MIYAFIRDHLVDEFPVRLCCRTLGVSTSGYYHARVRGPSRRACRRVVLAEHVRTVHADSRAAYGSPRIAHELRRRGVSICRNTAATLMRQMRLRPRRSRRFRPRTTDSSGTIRPAPNLLKRDFACEAVDRVWLADITYVPLREGFAYLAVVMDLHSRAIVGWSLGSTLATDLVCSALRTALRQRVPAPGLVHHSDRGSQYDSVRYRDLLAGHGMLQSMSRRGDCYDNAPMESFFASLKAELVGDTPYRDADEARDMLVWYIDGFYNRSRLHSSIGYRTPMQAQQRTL